MSSNAIEQIHAWLRNNEQELLDNYRKMLRIASVEGDAAPNAPFGPENREALDLALQLGSEWGMQTKDLEGFCGYSEFGKGEKLVAVFGHLDVVPVGPGWKNGPFDADIVDGYVVARGAVDDKGPTMAAYYAARAIKEICGDDIGGRLRVVFGCDEESGFKCIERYVQTEEAPTYGVAPDAGWPLIHAEKGIANFIVKVPLFGKSLRLKSIVGGQRPNIVIDTAQATLDVSESVRGYVEGKIAEGWDRNISTSWNGSELTIQAQGKAAHGSWPFGGDNAAIRIMRFLMEIAPLEDQEAYTELFEMTHIGGLGIGIDGRDEITDLTCNLGIIETIDGALIKTYNVRYPVTWKGPDLKARCEAHLAKLCVSATLADFTDSKPLYFPLDHPLVKIVCDSYTEETGDTTRKPGVMGGGTYARAVPNTVAIGTGWLGDGEAHQTDEKCAIESLYKMSRIYATILYRLLQSS